MSLQTRLEKLELRIEELSQALKEKDYAHGIVDGYNFWLAKLNQFNGDFRKADMVKAFITSTEYRARFGP